MGETSWNREVREQHFNSSVTLLQVISPPSRPPAVSNGVSASFDSIGSCTPAETMGRILGTSPWTPCVSPGDLLHQRGLQGEAQVQVTHKASTLATPGDRSLGVHISTQLYVCSQNLLELSEGTQRCVGVHSYFVRVQYYALSVALLVLMPNIQFIQLAYYLHRTQFHLV